MNAVGPPPDKSKKRKVGEAVGTAMAGGVPYAGGALAVVWQHTVGAAYERRRREWEEKLVSAVNDLIDRVADLEPDDLASNDQFLDAVAYATNAAIATGQNEKLEALRNAVLNAALPSDLDADTQAIFLRHVRDFTPSHLKLLKLLDDPPGWFETAGIEFPEFVIAGNLMTVVKQGLPEMADREPAIRQMDSDLSSAGLTGGGLNAMMTADGVKASRTTDTGKAFLRFITDPRDRLF